MPKVKQEISGCFRTVEGAGRKTSPSSALTSIPCTSRDTTSSTHFGLPSRVNPLSQQQAEQSRGGLFIHWRFRRDHEPRTASGRARPMTEAASGPRQREDYADESVSMHALAQANCAGLMASILADAMKFSMPRPGAQWRMNSRLASLGAIRMVVKPAAASMPVSASMLAAPATHAV